jgi:sugar/nucleoside kinase (ribokinase family)
MSILALGTVALDTVKTPFGARKRILGGSAVHFAMSARLFTDVHLAAVVGEDFPQAFLSFLKQKGVILDSLIKSQGKTFHWEGEYKQDFNTAITLNTELGVLLSYKPVITPQQSRIKNIFLANLDPDIQNNLLERLRSPKLVALDSMNYWIHHKRESLLKVLKKVDIYMANDQEARSLSGENNLIKAAKSLYRLGPKMILIKKGEHGAILFSDKLIHSAASKRSRHTPLSVSPYRDPKPLGRGVGGSIFCIPAFPSHKVIDPTGAGDTFAGGFMGYLARQTRATEKALKKAVVYGTVAASFNIEDFGTDSTAGLRRKDLEKRLAEFRKFVLF